MAGWIHWWNSTDREKGLLGQRISKQQPEHRDQYVIWYSTIYWWDSYQANFTSRLVMTEITDHVSFPFIFRKCGLRDLFSFTWALHLTYLLSGFHHLQHCEINRNGLIVTKYSGAGLEINPFFFSSAKGHWQHAAWWEHQSVLTVEPQWLYL